jgi:hypothetical protein
MTHSSPQTGRPSRRDFLGTLAAGLAATATGPTLLGATDKAGAKRPVIGSGAHTYEVFHDWGELPAGLKYGNTHGVVEDAQGHIYVHHTVHATSDRQDTMVVFDEKGKFVRSWGPQYAGGAHGLHIRTEGSGEFLYLCDTKRATVSKVTLKGELVWQLRRSRRSIRQTPTARRDRSTRPPMSPSPPTATFTSATAMGRATSTSTTPAASSSGRSPAKAASRGSSTVRMA